MSICRSYIPFCKQMTLRAFYTLCTVGCAGGWVWTWLSWTFAGQGLWRGCLFKQLFHVPCPSCGSTRAILALLRGDVAASVACNPLGLLLAAGLAVLPLWLLTDLLCRRASLYRLFLRVDLLLRRRRVFAVFVCLVLANWAWVLFHWL